jgi:hypothetical protein
MGQTVDQIEAHLERQREALRAHLDELEENIEIVFNWRYVFRTHPVAMMGAAFGGGVLLARLTTRSRQARGAVTRTGDAVSRTGDLDVLDQMKSALIGVATTRLARYISELIPDFAQQLHLRRNRVRQ